MSRPCAAFAVMLVVAVAGLCPARAVPPTVTPSPGYDARLQEQRKAMSTTSPIVVGPVVPFTATSPRPHSKRKH